MLRAAHQEVARLVRSRNGVARPISVASDDQPYPPAVRLVLFIVAVVTLWAAVVYVGVQILRLVVR